MNPRIAKEIRSITPAFACTLLLTVATSLIWNALWDETETGSSLVISCFWFCGVIMAAGVFGSEFSTHTIGLLLSQPVSRRTIWWEKHAVLGVALAIGYLALLIFFRLPGDFLGARLLLALLPVCIFCSAPLLSLGARGTMLGAIIALFFPMTIWALVALSVWLFGLEKSLDEHPAIWIFVPTSIYCVLTYFLGYKTFMNLQVTGALTTEVQLPARLERAISRPVTALLPGYRTPFTSLVRKELQLQRIPFWFATACICVAPLAALMGTIQGPSWLHETAVGLFYTCVAMCIAIVPIISTGVAVAEERNWGILGWQFSQPVSLARQWRIKILVLAAVNLLLGVVAPFLLLFLAKWSFGFNLDDLLASRNIFILLYAALVWLLLLHMGLFSSSAESTSFRAIVIGLGLPTGCATIVIMLGRFIMPLLESFFYAHTGLTQWILARFGITQPDGSGNPPLIYPLELSLLVFVLAALAFLVTLIHRYAYANFRSTELNTRRTWTQVAIIVFWLVAFAFVAFTLATLLGLDLQRVYNLQPLLRGH